MHLINSAELIHEVIAGDRSPQEIADSWGVSLRTIRHIKRGRFSHFLKMTNDEQAREDIAKVKCNSVKALKSVPQSEKLVKVARGGRGDST